MSNQSSETHFEYGEVTDSSYTTRRYFAQRDEPLGWWPGGLLPLLGLLLFFLWGLLKIAPDIERSTQIQAHNALTEAGYADLDVTADGQQVMVKGAAFSEEAKRIERIARGATCDTFVSNDLVCPTDVTVTLEDIKNARYHNFSMVRTAAGGVIRGEVPDDATRNSVLSEARSRLGAVVDSLQVTGERKGPAHDWALGKAWAFLDQVSTGRISWTDGVLSAVGRTTRDKEDAIRSRFSSTQYGERIGDLNLQFVEDVDRCNEEFKKTLATSVIRFETGSAQILTASQPLLAELAQMASACPGNLIIEGHTDDVGEADMNQALSQRRAQAVVDALAQLSVNKTRLTARGYGEERPIASNTTSRTRALNRRIEIRIADF